MKTISLFLIILFIVSFFGMGCAGGSSQQEPIEKVKVPVLLYHHLDPDKTNKNATTPDKFESDIKNLIDNGYNTISLRELLNYVDGIGALPENPILITFDDGYTSFYDYAFPILKKFNCKAVLFIIGWSIGRTTFTNSDKPITPHCTWEQLKDMSNSQLIEIQNHTYDLHSPKGFSYGYEQDVNTGVLNLTNEGIEKYEYRLLSDLYSLNFQLQHYLETTYFFISYPYGAHSDMTNTIIENSLFNGSFTTETGARYFSSKDCLYNIPRFTVPNTLINKDLILTISNLPEK